ncbi:ABC transporter ATP-binding protein [Candidatus Dependentiae bacterium]|nr:ABC transporter ATP-binding protein [Candidatus Dependentiae bacterium]
MADNKNSMENNNFSANWNFLKPFVAKYKVLIIVSVVFMILFSLTSPLQLWILKPFVDKLFQKNVVIEYKVPEKVVSKLSYINKKVPVAKSVSKELTVKIKSMLAKKYTFNKKYIFVFISGYLIIMSFLKGFFKFCHSYTLIYAVGAVIKDIRIKMYEKILSMPFKFYSNQKAGDLLSRFTNDISVLQSTLSTLIIQTIEKPAEIFFLTIFVFMISWKLSLIAFTIVPAAGLIIYFFGKMIRKYILKIQLKISDITQYLQESIYGIKIIKAFTAENRLNSKFKSENEIFFVQNLKSWKLQILASPVIELFTMFGVIAVMWAALYFSENDELTSGTIITFIAALMTMYKPIKELTQLNVNYHQVNVMLGRITEILNVKDDIVEQEQPIELEKVTKLVTFNNVCFSYGPEENEILKNISFTVNAGKTAAIIGPSGTGKTTLVNLLPRFYDVSSGIISFDRINIKNYSLNSLRKNIAIVEQEIFLFNDTIKNNICFPETEPDMERVIEAAKLANAYDFIMQIKDGFDSVIGDRGQLLSVGQKQRIAIARAIYKPASVLILDEATSSLDSESEKLVQNAIDNLMKKYTTFVIAHRLSTIVNADIILVLKDGEIAEIGNHQQLLNKNGLYAYYYNTQFQKQ